MVHVELYLFCMSKGALPIPAGSCVLTVVLLIIISMIAGQETLPEEITGFKHVIGWNNSQPELLHGNQIAEQIIGFTAIKTIFMVPRIAIYVYVITHIYSLKSS